MREWFIWDWMGEEAKHCNLELCSSALVTKLGFVSPGAGIGTLQCTTGQFAQFHLHSFETPETETGVKGSPCVQGL